MIHKLDRFMVGVLAMAAFLAGLHTLISADTGKFAATRAEVGNTFQTRRMNVSDGGLVTIAAAADNRPDATCFNDSTFVVRIGSASSVSVLQTMGFPILSSTTFKLGSMSGAVSAVMAGTAGSTATIICADGLTN